MVLQVRITDEVMGQDPEVDSRGFSLGVFLAQVQCPTRLRGVWGTLVVPSGLSTRASCPSGPPGRPPPLRMSHCSSRALTLLSSVFGACGLLLVGIAVSTDYWLYMEEGTVLPQNQTTEVKMALHAGLWRVCFFAGRRLPCPPGNSPTLPGTRESLSIVPSLGCQKSRNRSRFSSRESNFYLESQF